MPRGSALSPACARDAGGAGSVAGTHSTALVAKPTRNRVARGRTRERGAAAGAGKCRRSRGKRGREGDYCLVIRKQGIPSAPDTILKPVFYWD